MNKALLWMGAHLSRLRGEILYSGASVLTSVVAFLGSVIAARALEPEELGVMQTLLLIPTYCTFLPLGVFNGLNRNIAFYLGRQDHAKVQVMVSSSWAVAKLVSVAGAAISLGFGIYYLHSLSSPLYLGGMIFVAVGLILEPFSQHLEVVYLSSRHFRSLGARTLWQNLVTALTSWLPLVAGVWGFVASRCAFYMARFFSRRPGVPIGADGHGTFTEAKELAVTGAPLLIAGVLYGYLGAADRSVIACFMKAEDVGHYSLTALVVTGNQFIPFCLAALFYPRLAACYGRTGSPDALRRYFWILLVVNIAIVLPTCLGMYFAIEPLVGRYLPKYVEGVPAAKIGCISSLAFIYIGVGGVIAVIRKNTPYVIAIAASLLVVWLLGGYWVTHGYGIAGAVWARAIATAALCLFTIVFAYRLTGQQQKVRS